MSLSLIRYIKLFFICSSILFSNSDHLIFNRITIQPTEAELIAIYNPTNQSIDLSNYYITDATKSSDGVFYYNLPSSENFWSGNVSSSSGATDFIARFPENYSIQSNETLVLGLHDSQTFTDYYGYDADLTLFEDMRNALDEETTISLGSAFVNMNILGDDTEMLMVFHWDGNSDIVEDVDYFIWGNINEAIDKTDVSGYLPDTNPNNQSFYYSHGEDSTYVRTTINSEGNEISSGGNGIGIEGDDETSEDLINTWSVILSPEIVYGCTDSEACNYNPEATSNDGSCWSANNGCSCDDTQGSESDCAGVCNGTAVEDCSGFCQGNAEVDICGVCDGPGAIYDCGCLNINIPEGSNPYEECVDITIEEIYNQYDSCDDNLAEFKSTIGLIIDYEDVTASNGPRVITLQDPQGDKQIDVTVWDWDPADSDNGYHPDISNYIDPYNPTQYYVIVDGLIGTYNCNFQLDASEDGYGGVSIDGTITYFNELNTGGDYQLDENVTKAHISVAPYVLIPTSGERIDFNYSFPNQSRVIIRVFDLSGRFITTLVDHYFDSSGTVYMQEDNSDWDGRDHLGQVLSPGTYIMHIEAMNFQTGITTSDMAPVVIGIKP